MTKKSFFHFLCTLHLYPLKNLVRSPFAFIFLRLKRPSALCLSQYLLCCSPNYHGSPQLHSLLYFRVCLVSGVQGLQGSPTSAKQSVRIPAPWWFSPRCGGCFATWARCCLLAICWPQVLQDISAELLTAISSTWSCSRAKFSPVQYLCLQQAVSHGVLPSKS